MAKCMKGDADHLIRKGVEAYLARRLLDLTHGRLVAEGCHTESCYSGREIFDLFHERIKLGSATGRPFGMLQWAVGDRNTVRIGGDGKVRSMQSVGNELGVISLSPADIVLHVHRGRGIPMHLHIHLIPTTTGLMVVSNAGNNGDLTPVEKFMERIDYGVLANDIVRHRAGVMATWGAPENVDRVAEALAREISKEAENDPEPQATPMLVVDNAAATPNDPAATYRVRDHYTPSEAATDKAMLDRLVGEGRMYVWAARGYKAAITRRMNKESAAAGV